MKYLLTAVTLFFASLCYAQTGTPVLFLADQNATLFIDGIEMSPLNINEPYKIYLSAGDHMAQAKTSNEIVNKPFSCRDANQIIVSFTFGNAGLRNNDQSKAGQPGEKLVFHNTVLLNEYVKNGTIPENKYFSFDTNDKVKFNYRFADSSGTLNLTVYSYPDRQIIYSNASGTAISDSFTSPARGVYYFSMTSNEIRKKTATLKITRIPAKESPAGFRTSVLSRPDTIFHPIVSITNLIKKKKLSFPVGLPANTRFWAYWIGVGNEAIINYDNYSELYAAEKSGNEKDLMYAYGAGRIDELPRVISKEVMDYEFADKANTQKFLDGNPYESLSFKKEKAVTTAWSKVFLVKNNTNLLVSVPERLIGQKIKIVFVSFEVKDNYVVDEAKN